MSAATGSLVSRIYKGFRGVDFRSDETNFARSPDSLNVWKDYKEIDSIRTRPELKRVTDFFDEPVLGYFVHGPYSFVHSGDKLYEFTYGQWAVAYSGLEKSRHYSFVFNDTLYIKGSGVYLMLDNRGFIKKVEGYVPTTSIGRKPSGGGSTHEDVNLLSRFRINTFLADGESKTFVLDAQKIVSIELVTVNGEERTDYEVDVDAGSITFTGDAPPAPLTDGQDNVSIKFCKYPAKYETFMTETRLVQIFDNRVFFADYSKIWHSSLNDPTYFSDLDYYKDGVNNARIKGMVAGNNALWVFTAPADGETTVFYHTPAIDSQYGKVYPAVHSSITTGCSGGAINFNDDIVFFSDRGMEGISGDITTEQALVHRSSLVDRKLISYNSTDYKSMDLIEWEGYLFVFVGDKAFLADSRAKFTNGDHFEYEWFYWDMGVEIEFACVDEDGVLYVGAGNAVFSLTDMDAHVESYWVTPKDRFGAAHKLKTTNKRGCVAEATGDITVYAKTEDTEFEKIGEYKDVEDYFVSRIKRKKFKDLQLKFHSNTRFSLESATLEAWVGGYIKR